MCNGFVHDQLDSVPIISFGTIYGSAEDNKAYMLTNFSLSKYQ